MAIEETVGVVADVDGKWAIDVATLAGSRRFNLSLTTAGATVTGTAVGDTGPVPIRDGRAVGDRLEFVIDLVAPLPMSLVFDLRVVGNRMTGTAQSGILPAMTVLGARGA